MGLTYVITGANRVIGKGVLEAYISRPNTTVIAAVRNIESITKALSCHCRRTQQAHHRQD